MANKNNIRSIRFSDELAELIDQQVGRTFTEKFENLITVEESETNNFLFFEIVFILRSNE